MEHAYKSADFVFFPAPVAPSLRGMSRVRNVNKTQFWTYCATCWPLSVLYLTFVSFPYSSILEAGGFTSEYHMDILTNMKKREKDFLPKWNYMTKQPDITFTMRSILIDWLIGKI